MSFSDLVIKDYKVTAMSSSSLLSKAADDVSIAFNDSVSPVCDTGGANTSDAPLIPGLQLIDTRHLKRPCPLQAHSSTSKIPKRGASIDDLPDELMLEIFSYMCSNEIINVLQEVCIRWKILAHDVHLWRHREYVVRSEQEALETFAAMPQLRTVNVEKYVTMWFFVGMSKYCPHLTTLQTNPDQDLPYEVAAILFDGCKNIESLTVSDLSLRDRRNFIGDLARLEHLRVLHLIEVKDFVLGMVSFRIELRVLADNCPHLSDLELGSKDGIDYEMEAAEYFISSHKHVLQHLSIKWMSVEKRSIAPLLPRVETLQSLRLLNVLKVSPEEVTEANSALGQLHSLQQLRIVYLDEESERLFPTTLANGGFPKLRVLEPGYICEGETIRAVVEHCPELEELVLSHTEGDDEDLLEPLQQLKKLKIKLEIYECEGDQEVLDRVCAQMPYLRTEGRFGITETDEEDYELFDSEYID